MRTYLLIAALLASALAFGQQTSNPAASNASKTVQTNERDAWRDAALAKVNERLGRLHDEEKVLAAKRAEVGTGLRALSDQEKKAGMEAGLEGRQAMMAAAQKEVAVQEKILN